MSLTAQLPAQQITPQLVAALQLAERGYSVFPLRGKVPALARRAECRESRCPGGCGRPGHGVLDATKSLERVVHLWRLAGPHSNIGLRVPAEWVVLDVDPRSGGIESLAKLPPLPATVGAISGRGDGGRHHYFLRPDPPWEPDAGQLTGTGLDLKTSTGYVVAPPSVHPATGQPYRWAAERTLAPLPEWLRELLTPPARPARQAPGAGAPGNIDVMRPRRTGASPAAAGAWRPIDAFNDAHTVAEILDAHGWELVGKDRWRHPSATAPWSATERDGRLYVYSTNAGLPVTTPGRAAGLSPFDVWCQLAHAGNVRAAIAELRPGR